MTVFPPVPVLSVSDLSITTPAGVTLVEGSDFAIHRGEIVLLIGPSGSGKTSIVNVLCGLLERSDGAWDVRGRVASDGREIDLATEMSDLCGLVFQGNALFDDLTAGENLRIAVDHANAFSESLVEAVTSLFPDIEPGKGIADCSGGQRQRIAIARTLLSGRAILILDEPNSGLDIKSSRRLASLVKRICKESGKPAIIVAHHVEDLLPLADRVLLLDTRQRMVRSIDGDMDTIEREMMALEVGADVPAGTEASTPAVWRNRLQPRSDLRWFLRYFAEYFWVLCASPFMLGYLGLGGVILGFVSVWFGFNYHSFGGYLKSILHDETLEGIGYVQTTVAVPLIASILVNARNSAIIAADLSNRILSRQFKAMRNLNIPAMRYLVLSIVINNSLALVLLNVAALTAASWSALQTWRFFFPDQPFEFWQENYFRRFVEAGPGLIAQVGWVFAKMVLSSGLASLAAIAIGLRRKTSVVSINNAISEAIVIGVSVTLLAHAVVAVLQFWKR
jgi:ABC-type multidrug transport system ATPase subunit/ABC-type transporter Mla maintaining outer membrane lipid asymmetry permease subunit MlaE